MSYIVIARLALVALLVIVRYRWAGGGVNRYLLTVSGDARTFFDGDAGSAVERVRPLVKELEVQRLDHEGERVELRAVVTVDARDGAAGLLTRLRGRLPALQFSFVEADDVL